MKTLVLLRHGESRWNLENRFTGWTDVDLTERGEEEARGAGRMLRKEGYVFDVAYTSMLKRAIRTLWLILEEMDLVWIPVFKSWRLNERHYGALQGLDKAETAMRHTKELVQRWRRSYDVRPPKLNRDDPRYPGRDPRYAALGPEALPLTESLRDTVHRFLPYWRETISPVVREGRRVIVVAHGNSLRALVKHLEEISDEQIADLNIPTGVPLVYELGDNLKPIRRQYLGEKETIQRAVEDVADPLRRKS